MQKRKLSPNVLGYLPSPVPLLILLALGCSPVATRADTLTLDGASVESVSFDAPAKTFSVQMATTDALQYKTDVMLGTKIDLLTLDEFATVDGTTTETVIEFARDVAQSFHFTDSDMLTSDVTFRYEELKITEGIVIGGSGGGGNAVPEPSSVALLASGLLGLVSFGRQKHRS
jgi:hypothetical protein